MDLISLLSLSTLLVLSSATTDTYIVRVQNDLKPSQFSQLEDWYSSTLRTLSTYSLQSEPEPNQNQNSDFIYVYKNVFHGFSARLTKEQAEELSGREEILGVLPDRVHRIQTTRSGRFMGLDGSNPTGLMTESDSGSNVIIGVLDTGIWPERRSFGDDGLGPIPTHWRGECVEGERFKRENCNKKVIGARYFTSGYEARIGGLNKTVETRSPRDTDGHGTHTASTAAGRAVANASLFGLAAGVAVGIAPKARIAAYKICWRRGCLDSDILAAFDAAVSDGVDVISLSVGGSSGTPYSMDPIAIGSFSAAQKGIFVSVAAGNGGPMVRSVSNAAPWVTSVGAGTIDRQFPVDLVLGDGSKIVGASLYTGKPFPRNKLLPIVYAGNASLRNNNHMFGGSTTCLPGSLDKNLVRGKIVVCDRGGTPRVTKGQIVKDAGGVGVVVANVYPLGEGLIADPHIIPGLSITESAANKLRAYISDTKDPRATMIFRGTQIGVKPSPVVASFSSRGPNPESVYVLKPDVIAPGVNILAAWPDDVAPTDLPSDSRRTEFNMASGTSMSCPHVSGLAALLKGAHPDWSAAMIRSALMTTAYTHDHSRNPLLDEATYNVSNVWGTGSGHVDPQKAVDPGLVYDLTAHDYIEFLCASGYDAADIKLIAHKPVNCPSERRAWNINYPAMSFGAEAISSNRSNHEIVFNRTVTNVFDGAASYFARVVPPKGMRVRVEPIRLEFKKKGEKRSFSVKVRAERVPRGIIGTQSGKLMWTDGKHHVSSPIVVVGSA